MYPGPAVAADAGDRVSHAPLTMALWALCVVAEADGRRVVGEGQQSLLPFPPPLNVWMSAGGEPGPHMYRHAWLRQKARGLPPGAVVQRSLVVRAEVSEDVEEAQETDPSGKAEEADICGKAEGTDVHVKNESSKNKDKKNKRIVVDHVIVADGVPEPWSSRLWPRKRHPNYRF